MPPSLCLQEDIDMNVAVYCGSSAGNREAYLAQAAELGEKIAEHGHTLVYGGSNTGLMGAVADGALAVGGRVVGVQPGNVPLIQSRRHPGLTENLETGTMAERRSKMIELADAYIALPGGVGTLDEISEVLVLQHLGLIDAPIVFVDTDGYYQPLRTVFEQMIAEGFCEKETFRKVLFSGDLDEIMTFLG